MDIELYGGKRGMLEHIRARALYALGAYGNIRDLEWPSVRRLVFVCAGNICRSPYASHRARSLGIPAASYGLDAAEGAPADKVASKNALLRGIDLSAHRSARMESNRIADGDLVIVFEPGQLAEVRRRIGDRTPAELIGIWSRPKRPHIQDPYGRSDRYFQQCFSVIDANITKLIERMARGGAPAAMDLPR
jgi:protein-tyrosine phosphatase